MTLPLGDHYGELMSQLGLDGGDIGRPDDWLAAVDQPATPPPPPDGGRVRNEPHTVAAPPGAAASGGSIPLAIDAAMRWLGTPYDWGGNGQNGRGVDCSGLVYAAFKAAGFNVERYRAIDYGHMGTPVDEQDARPGDIVYFDNPGTDTDHVGIYLGNGKFIESPQPGERVQVSNLRRGAQIRRIFPEGAYSDIPTTPAGNYVYNAPNGQRYVAPAKGAHFDPLTELMALNVNTDPNALLTGLDAKAQLDKLMSGPDLTGQAPHTVTVHGTKQPSGGGDSLSAFLNAVSGQESGGDYRVVNSIGAIGKYQVMSGNVAEWTREALGYSMTPEQFRNSPSAQEAVARKRLGDLVAKYGFRGAAAAWYSGNPDRANDYSHVSNGPSVGSYVDQVMARMGL